MKNKMTEWIALAGLSALAVVSALTYGQASANMDLAQADLAADQPVFQTSQPSTATATQQPLLPAPAPSTVRGVEVSTATPAEINEKNNQKHNGKNVNPAVPPSGQVPAQVR